MSKGDGSSSGARAGKVERAAARDGKRSSVDWLNDYFGGRLGAGEFYRPNRRGDVSVELEEVGPQELVRLYTHARDMPARMARDYYLSSLASVGRPILAEFDELRPLLQAALDSKRGDPKDWIDGEPPAQSTSVRWLLDYYLNSLSGSEAWVRIHEPGSEALCFVDEVRVRAMKFNLEPWIVESLIRALFNLMWGPVDNWEFELGHVGTSSACPLEPEEHIYYARQNPDADPAPVVRATDMSGRAFAFVHQGYRAAGVRRALFMQICREQFEEALSHYVEAVERDYQARGYVQTPEMRDAKKFEWAVLRRNLGWSLSRIEDRADRTRSTISDGIREVERAMHVHPLKMRVTKKRGASRRTRRGP